MYELKEYTEKVFEDIKHFDENENEYCNARELMLVLEYKEWRKFEHVIIKAINACSGSDYNLIDHFVLKDKMINIGKGGKRKVKDYISLSDLACYIDKEEPRFQILNWMRNKDVILYLGLWEELNNDNLILRNSAKLKINQLVIK